MTCTIRLTIDLIQIALVDLDRPHPFAFERVGFFHARAANAGAEGWLLLPFAYVPVPDGQYLRDETVGARINGNAIRGQMQVALRGDTSILHVHKHDHSGTPTFSSVDRHGYPLLLRAMRNAGPRLPHGALVLSRDSALATVLVPGAPDLQIAKEIVVVGRPMRFIAEEGEIYG